MKAVHAAASALWEVDAGVAYKPQPPSTILQMWIAENQTNASPPPPFQVVPYVPHHPPLPVPVFDAGNLPTGPKVEKKRRYFFCFFFMKKICEDR